MTHGGSGTGTVERFRPALSIWSWLAMSPYLLTAFAGIDVAADPQQLALGVLTAVIVHAALLVVVLVGGWVERRLAPWPRIRWAFVGLAILGIAAARPALLTALQREFGIDLVDTPGILRFLMNAVLIGAAVLLIHGVIGALHRGRQAERRLAVVREALAEEGRRIASARAAVAASFQADLAREVLDALGALLHQRLPADVLAKELRWIARSVVQRAAQHARQSELDAAVPESDIDWPTGLQLDGGGATSRLPTISAGPAWAIALVSTLIFVPPVISVHGTAAGGLLLLVSGVVAFILTLTIERVPLPTSRRSAITVLGLLYLGVGMVASGLLLGPAGVGAITAYYFAYGSVGFAIIATVIVLITGGLRGVRASEQRIAEAIAEAEHRRFDAQRRLIIEAVEAGRVLDTDVQGDVLATSYLIEAGSAAPDALEELIDRIEWVLRGTPAAPLDTAPLIREGLEATLRAWSRTLHIETEVDEDAIAWIIRNPGAAGLAHDAITEGLTTAVRFGRTAEAIVIVRRTVEAVEIAVRSPGGFTPRDDGGIGLHDLEHRADRVEILEQDGGAELRVGIRISR